MSRSGAPNGGCEQSEVMKTEIWSQAQAWRRTVEQSVGHTGADFCSLLRKEALNCFSVSFRLSHRRTGEVSFDTEPRRLRLYSSNKSSEVKRVRRKVD